MKELLEMTGQQTENTIFKTREAKLRYINQIIFLTSITDEHNLLVDFTYEFFYTNSRQIGAEFENLQRKLRI